MKKRTGHTLRTALYSLALLLVGSFGLTGCGEDDPVTPPKDYGFSSVTFLHANPGRITGIAFFLGDTTLISADASEQPQYEGTFKKTVPNGESQKYTVKDLSGTELASTTAAHDSSQYIMVIYSGNATASDVFVAATKKISSSSGGKVAVRFVHAAKDAGSRSLKIGAADGASIASNVSYKGASGAFISVDVATDTLWIVDESGAKAAIPVPVNLSVGEVWTIVFHGSEGALTPELKWRGTPIADK
ncbi:MAG: hypothetical protein AB7H80_14625 [Candidatus Kapaibacterium sp.]